MCETSYGFFFIASVFIIGCATSVEDETNSGTDTVIVAEAVSKYEDGRPEATLRMDAKDHGVDDRLALIYDAPEGNSKNPMKRHIGLAWLDLPLSVPRS